MRDRRDDTGGINIKQLFDELVELSPTDQRDRLSQFDDQTRKLLEELIEADRAESDLQLNTESFFDDSSDWLDSVPDRLGRFVFLDQLGEGGAAVVMLADDSELSRQVAIKLMPATDDSVTASDEPRAQAPLEHSSVVRLYESGIINGWRYLAMEHMAGGSLADALTKDRADSPARQRQFLSVVASIADALQFTHDLGITHCDVKPSNILFDRDGHARLSDFGAARRAEPNGKSQGEYLTPRYAAPEQLLGETPTTAADIYALGAVMFEIITGERPPGKGERSDPSKVYSAMEAKLARIRFPRANLLRAICLDCLEPMPTERYPRADAVAADLRRWLSLTHAHAEAEQLAWPVLRPIRRHPRLAVALNLLALAGLLAWVLWPADQRARVSVVTPSPSVSAWIEWIALDPATQEHAAVRNLGRTPIKTVRLPPGPGQLVARSVDGSRVLAEQPIQLEPESQFDWEPELVATERDSPEMIEIHPAPESRLLPFAIGKYEVTHRTYEHFATATGIERPRSWPLGDLPEGWDDLPVTGITYEEAAACAAWYGLSLPTA